MSTPSGSLRLRQKASLSESLNGLKSGTSSKPLSKRPSFTSSASSSLTSSQRLRFNQPRAEAVFDQSTPFSTIRLMMARASKSPNDPAPAQLFRQVMDYFGTDDDHMMTMLQHQLQTSHLQENSNPSESSAIKDMISSQTNSGTSTPAGDLGSKSRELSNAEIMLYISTMLGHLPRGTPEGVLKLEELFDTKFYDGDSDGLGYVSDCEPCDIDETIVDIQSSQQQLGEEKMVLGEKRVVRRPVDENYDMD
ncbi:hypothetical protein TWF694_011222 [Orbilia ellipsospora]|uniref:Uncharacterized protein n=1 Tax=Orbilia ellipsospora TaxID=2528407 RepID=A0AAV9X8E1_9PEZI